VQVEIDKESLKRQVAGVRDRVARLHYEIELLGQERIALERRLERLLGQLALTEQEKAQ